MNILSKLYYQYKKILKTIRLYLIIAGPGIIVMVADNDAGGITTYTATGAQYGFLVLLGPVAYYVQEMTVRLGAVTKRGHAEAIFHSFGAFWGWFSLLDLMLVDWLTMITEFVGMTAAMSIFGVPPLVTVIVAWILMGTMVLQGRYGNGLEIVFLGNRDHHHSDSTVSPLDLAAGARGSVKEQAKSQWTTPRGTTVIPRH